MKKNFLFYTLLNQLLLHLGKKITTINQKCKIKVSFNIKKAKSNTIHPEKVKGIDFA